MKASWDWKTESWGFFKNHTAPCLRALGPCPGTIASCTHGTSLVNRWGSGVKMLFLPCESEGQTNLQILPEPYYPFAALQLELLNPKPKAGTPEWESSRAPVAKTQERLWTSVLYRTDMARNQAPNPIVCMVTAKRPLLPLSRPAPSMKPGNSKLRRTREAQGPKTLKQIIPRCRSSARCPDQVTNKVRSQHTKVAVIL